MGMRGQKKEKYRIPALKLKYRILLYICMAASATLALFDVAYHVLPYLVGIMIYVLAACSLTLVGFYLVPDIKLLRRRIQTALKPIVGRHRILDHLVRDYRYRTVTFTTTGLLLNLIFAIFNGVTGIRNRSAWYVTMAVYYTLLSVMRFWAVNYERHISKKEQTKKVKFEEISVYRNCSMLFLTMTFALGGMAVLTMHSNGGKQYPGLTIYAFALYAFIKIPIAVAGRVKVIKMKSPLLMTIRSIGYADACAAVLSLQTAMLSSFSNGEEQADFAGMMNAITGAVVCIMVFTMGIYGIYSAGRQKRELQNGGIENDQHTCS